MATLKSYIERMPHSHTFRYNPTYWLGWANSLLERMSGMGVLPPKWMSAVLPVFDEMWVDKPALCRDVLSLHNPNHQRTAYPFEEINGRLRLLIHRFKEQTTEDEADGIGKINFTAEPSTIALGESSILSWDVEMAYVKAGGIGKINFTAEPSTIAHGGSSILSWDVEMAYVKAGGPVLLKYIQAYEPIDSIDSELAIGPYDNLIEAWLRWKVEEHMSPISQECGYWRSRVDVELHQLRGEAFNRVNPIRGRELIGFM